MSRNKRRLRFVISLLVLSSITCSMPGVAPTRESEVLELEALEIVEQEILTENVAAYAADLISDPETGELMELIRADGYTSFVEGGDFSYSNGGIMHTVSLTNGESLVVLAQMETQEGSVDAMVFESINENTMLIWDQSGSIEITVNEDGEIDYSVKDHAGNPISENEDPLISCYKTASITPQIVNSCTNGMGDEFDECIKRNPYLLSEIALCEAAFAVGVHSCFTPPFVDCVGLLALAVAYCGVNFGDCIWEMVDDPPTYEYSKAEETESYSYCQDNNLVTETLYKVQVVCKDDRQPKPNDLTVFLSSNEAKEFTCTDCAGQTSRGTIPSPGDVSTIECEFGCQIVGDGNDRCLEEGETPQEAPAEESSIPTGTYEGTTTLPDLFDQGEDAQYWAGTDLENSIVVNVAADGTVTGGLSWVRVGNAYFDKSCAHYNDIDMKGTISGKLTDVTGEITLEIAGIITHKVAGDAEYCSAPDSQFDTIDDLVATVTITGNTMNGTIPESFTFTATK